MAGVGNNGGVRRVFATSVVFIVALAADALLLLAPAGHVLTGWELVLLVGGAVVGVGAAMLSPRPSVWALPVIAFLVFRFGLAPLVGVRDDAVLRDAQAGLAAAVVLAGQFGVVAIGMSIGRSRAATA